MSKVVIDRAVVERAMEALSSIDVGYRSPNGSPLEVSFDEVKCDAATAALRAALAQGCYERLYPDAEEEVK